MTAHTTIGRCLTPETAFTPAELRVLRRLLRGELPKEIALSIGHGERTIRWHISNMHKRVGVRGHTLVPWAYMHRECCGWAYDPPTNGRGNGYANRT